MSKFEPKKKDFHYRYYQKCSNDMKIQAHVYWKLVTEALREEVKWDWYGLCKCGMYSTSFQEGSFCFSFFNNRVYFGYTTGPAPNSILEDCVGDLSDPEIIDKMRETVEEFLNKKKRHR